MTTCSIRTGHGTATGKKKKGNAKCRSQATPPFKKTNASEILTTTSARSQFNNLQSGFASARNRIGRKSAAQMTMRKIDNAFAVGRNGVGLIGHRFQSR